MARKSARHAVEALRAQTSALQERQERIVQEMLRQPGGADGQPSTQADAPRSEAPITEGAASPVRAIPLGAIDLPGWNVRRQIEDAPEFDELVASIAQDGLLQPIVVSPHPRDPERYYLVSGERRYRAVKSLGWDEVPAHVLAPRTEAELQALVLVENLQRKDLSVLEEADGYRKLEAMGLSRHQIAERVKKSRSYIIAIMKIAEQKALRDRIDAGELSVRQAQEIARLVRDGNEVVAGALDWVCEWINIMRPTTAAIRDMVQRIIEAQALPTIPQPRRGLHTLADREIAHLEDVRAKLAKQSPVVLAVLAERYQNMADEARAVLAAVQSREENVQPS